MHTTKMITDHNSRGGTRKTDTKQAVTVRYSQDVLDAFKATGPGWQARMNDVLRELLGERSQV